MTTFWLSFCDTDKPEGQQFLGVVLVDAPTLEDAVTASWQAGANPGGQIASMAINDDAKRDGQADQVALFNALPRLKLLSRADIEAAGHQCVTTAEWEADD